MRITRNAIVTRWVIKVSLSLCRAQFICSYNKQISCIMRLLWKQGVQIQNIEYNSHMVLLHKLPRDSNDMHWYACYIPDCSLIDVHYLVSVDCLLSSYIKCNYCVCRWVFWITADGGISLLCYGYKKMFPRESSSVFPTFYFYFGLLIW